MLVIIRTRPLADSRYHYRGLSSSLRIIATRVHKRRPSIREMLTIPTKLCPSTQIPTMDTMRMQIFKLVTLIRNSNHILCKCSGIAIVSVSRKAGRLGCIQSLSYEFETMFALFTDNFSSISISCSDEILQYNFKLRTVLRTLVS